jgi:hypothetical protein
MEKLYKNMDKKRHKSSLHRELTSGRSGYSEAYRESLQALQEVAIPLT